MTTLKEEYRKSVKLQENLAGLTARQDSDEYQAEVKRALVGYEACERLVAQLSLFSDNETMDDLSTNDIEYMDVDYRQACMFEKVMGTNRRQALGKSADCYLAFLQRLDTYRILTNHMSRRLKDVLGNNKQLKYLQSSDATTRRQDKIDQFKLERALEEKLKLSTSLTDEDELRKIRFADLGLKAIRAFSALEAMAMELELLASAPDMEQLTDERERQRNQAPEQQRDGYQSGKLDKMPGAAGQGPLLDKYGKVNRPFTIVKSRDQIKKSAFGTGQTLPTMTVEEYIDEEIRQGNFLQGGEDSAKKEEPDEDNYSKVDEETYKAREWDEFAEANPKGSGNTMNLG